MRRRGERGAGVSFATPNRRPRPEATRRGCEGRFSTRQAGVALWSILRDARLRLVPQDERRGSRRDHRAAPVVLIAFTLLAAPVALLPVRPAAADDGAPVVSPDRIEDAPAITPDPYPDFDNFAWRAFIALNWPSLTDPAHRGEPDRAKTLGDPGPRVWETFKARYELFQVGPDGRPAAPRPWATYEAANPCGADVDNRAKTLATFTPFMDFNQSAFLPGIGANPLVAQNGAYTRYEGRLNEPEYSSARGSWLEPGPEPARSGSSCGICPQARSRSKPHGVLSTAADTPAVRARYYVVENANIVDVAKTLAAGHVVCSKSDVALVGLHIVIRTKDRPQGLWGTFEHVDNVPPAGEGEAREPDAKDAGAPYSYFDASKPKLGLWPTFGLPDTLAGQHGSSAQARPHAHAGGPPASDPCLDHGAEPGLLGAAGNQGNRVGALHAGRQPMADNSRARQARKMTAPISPGSRSRRTRRARITSRRTRHMKTWSTRRSRPTSRTRRQAACPATRASPTRSAMTSSACSAAFARGRRIGRRAQTKSNPSWRLAMR